MGRYPHYQLLLQRLHYIRIAAADPDNAHVIPAVAMCEGREGGMHLDARVLLGKMQRRMTGVAATESIFIHWFGTVPCFLAPSGTKSCISDPYCQYPRVNGTKGALSNLVQQLAFRQKIHPTFAFDLSTNPNQTVAD